MSSIIKGLWSDRTKWIMGLVANIIVSIAVALGTSILILRDELDEGKAVFGNIGYRYFSAVIGVYDKDTSEVRRDPEIWNAYRHILIDIREDIRWLRTNPLYGELGERKPDLAFVQNLLTRESIKKNIGIDPNTLHFMCSLYVESGYWEALEDQHKAAKDVREFSKRLCQHNRS